MEKKYEKDVQTLIDSRFKNLPITLKRYEKKGEWTRTVGEGGTIADLLKIWDIDDPEEMSEMAQVLRHLRKALRTGGHQIDYTSMGMLDT